MSILQERKGKCNVYEQLFRLFVDHALKDRGGRGNAVPAGAGCVVLSRAGGGGGIVGTGGLQTENVAAENVTVFLAKLCGDLLDTGIMRFFCGGIRRIIAAPKHTGCKKCAGKCTADLAHAAHTSAKGGGKAKRHVLIDPGNVGKSGKNRLCAV